jgi:effector-binding domain-containing protein
MARTAQVGTRVELDDLVERHVASVSTSIDRRRLQHTILVLHELVMDVIGEQGLAPAGPLFTRYHRIDTVITLEAGIPLAQPVRPVGVIGASTLPGGPTLRARHYGRHPPAPEQFAALERYCKVHGLRAVAPPWECYVIDARDTSDEGEWVTDVYLPVRTVRRLHRVPFGRGRLARITLPSRQAIR